MKSLANEGEPRRGSRAPSSAREWLAGASFAIGIALVGAGSLACTDEVPTPAVVMTDKLPALEPELVELIRHHASLVERTPRRARAHGQLGLVYEMNSLWSEARRSFENALLLEPDQPLWVLHAALDRQREGDSTGALAFMREHEARFRGSAPLQHLFGELLLANGDAADSEPAFTRAIELAPDRPEGYVGRGEARLARGDAEGASADLERAVALDPDYKSAHYQLGLALRALGRADEAQRELARGAGGMKRAMPDALAADSARFRVSRAERLGFASSSLEQGKPKQAMPALNAVLKYFPTDESALVFRTNALMQLGRWDDALAAANTVLEHHPENVAAWLYRAVAALQLGQRDEAQRSLARAKELEPESSLVHAYTSGYELATGKVADAVRSAEHAVELDPARIEGHVALGRACAASGDVERARAAFAKVLEIAPENPVARSELARLGTTGAPNAGPVESER